MVNLLLLLFLTSFQIIASADIDLDDSQWSKYTISSQNPVSIPILNTANPLLVITQNGVVSSYSKVILNNETKHSTTWFGENGYYLNFIPTNSGNVNFEVHTYTNNIKHQEVSIKIIDLKMSNTQLIKAIQDHAQAIHMRYMQFNGSENKNLLAVSLFESSVETFENQNLGLLKAIAMGELAFIKKDLEQNKQAIDLFDSASFEWAKLKNRYLELKTKNQKGLAQWQTFQLESALSTFNTINERLQSRKNNSPMYQFFHAKILNNIGLIYWEYKNISNAKKFFLDALVQYGIIIEDDLNTSELTRYIMSTPYLYDISSSLNNLALMNKYLGLPQRAGGIWQLVLTITQDKYGTTLNAIAKTNLSMIDIEASRYDEAKVMLNQAIKSFKSLNNTKWLYIAEYHLSLLNLKLGMTNLAEIQIEKNLLSRNATNNPQDIIELKLMLMEIYRIHDKYEQSIQLGLETLNLAKEAKHQKSITKIHQNNFIINMEQNKLSLASSDIEQAIISAKDLTLTKLKSELNIHKAELALLQNNTDQAINILKIETLKLKDVWDTKSLNKANNLLAQAYIKNNDNSKALEIITDEINNLIFYLDSSKSKQVQFNLYNTLKESLNKYAIINNNLKSPELGFIEINKFLGQSIVKNNSKNHTHIYNNTGDLLIKINAKSEALENSKLSDNDRKQIQNDMIELKAKIDFSYAAQKLTKVSNVSFKAVQDKIDDATLVIQYSIGNEGGISWWISKDKVESHEVANKNELSQLINLAHDEFIQKRRSDKYTQLLSTELLRPLNNFENITRIQLILDEPLNLVPFNALFDPRHEGKILAEITKIKRLASIQSISSKSNENRYDPHKYTSLIIADPVTTTTDERLSNSIPEEYPNPFTRLIGSKKEAENINRLIKAETIQGFDASKENLLASNFKDKNLLHFATHAFFHSEISGLSSLVLSTYNVKGENNSTAYLRALDISNLELNADLVVLSGCETGVNKYDNSLGLGGLTESFIQAGSKNLIASLWKVNDRVTEKMMTEFYKGYTNSLSIEDALWQAQKHIRETRRTKHPKYWAGWFLISQ